MENEQNKLLYESGIDAIHSIRNLAESLDEQESNVCKHSVVNSICANYSCYGADDYVPIEKRKDLYIIVCGKMIYL